MKHRHILFATVEEKLRFDLHQAEQQLNEQTQLVQELLSVNQVLRDRIQTYKIG